MKKAMWAMWLLVVPGWPLEAEAARGATGNGAAGGTEPTTCVASGCSGTVCVEQGRDMVTTCEHKPEYDCYREAACERQADGSCGWSQTAALTDCIEKARTATPTE